GKVSTRRSAAARADVVRAGSLVVPHRVAIAATDRDGLAILVVVALGERGRRRGGAVVEMELRQVLKPGDAVARGAAIDQSTEPRGGAGSAEGELLAVVLGLRRFHHAGRPRGARRIGRERAEDSGAGSRDRLRAVVEERSTAATRAAAQ